MREIVKDYYEKLNELVTIYGSRTLLLYQQGIFYYLFATDTREIKKIQNITDVDWTRGKASDTHMKCRFAEDKLQDYISLLTSNYYTVVCCVLKKNLCFHMKRLCECKKCSHTEGTHKVDQVIIPEDEQDYVLVDKNYF